MTQTNGTPQGMPTLAAMLGVVDALKRAAGGAITEVRIHPEDHEALRLQLTPNMIDEQLRYPPTIYGVKIVLDYSAARLPIK